MDFQGRGCSAPPNSPLPSLGKSLREMAALTEAPRGTPAGPGENTAAPKRSFQTTTVRRAVCTGLSPPRHSGKGRPRHRRLWSTENWPSELPGPGFSSWHLPRSLCSTMVARPSLNSHFTGGEAEARGGSGPRGQQAAGADCGPDPLPWVPFPVQPRSSPGGPAALRSHRWCRDLGLRAWSPEAQVPPIGPSTRKPPKPSEIHQGEDGGPVRVRRDDWGAC